MKLTWKSASRRVAAALALAAALVIAGCTPDAEVIVLAPTETPAGAVVPTRAPTDTPAATASTTPTLEATDSPTAAATDNPTATATDNPTATATNTPAPSATIEPTKAAPTPAPLAATATLPPSPPSPAAPTPMPVTTGLTAVRGGPVALAGPLGVGSLVTGTLDETTPWLVYPLQAQAGSVIDLKLDASGGSLDAVIHLLNAAGGEIARSINDGSGDLIVIRGIEVTSSDELFVAVTRAGGADGAIFSQSSGPFELSVSVGRSDIQVGAFSEPIVYGLLETTLLDSGHPAQLHTFDGSVGEIITIQTIGLDADLDTRLDLSDGLGNVIAYNDDDPLRPTRDSAIYDFVLPESRPYSILITRYSDTGASGEFQIKLTRSGQAAGGSLPALLNYANSVTIADDQTLITDYRAGDQIADDGQDMRVQTLLTFHLPALADGEAVGQAILDLKACTEMGDGFAGLGTLSVYADDFGDLRARRDFTRPSAGSRIIATADACGPLDITGTVAAAYAAGQDSLQLRLAFRTADGNQQVDEVRFEPALTITPAG